MLKNKLKRLIPYLNKSSSFRDHPFVDSTYAAIYGLDNSEWVEQRNDIRYTLFWNNKKLKTDGWFLHGIYNQIIANIVKERNIKSLLEVGSGRGNNVIHQSLSNPKVKIEGLEYSKFGNLRSKEFLENIPRELFSMVSDYQHNKVENINQKKDRVTFTQGNAFKMPYEDNTFDMSYTILVLEQMPHEYHKAIKEMYRVTRKYCVFIEPFEESNSASQLAHLERKDYFRFSYKLLNNGFKPILYTTNFPQKQKFSTGLYIAEVIK